VGIGKHQRDRPELAMLNAEQLAPFNWSASHLRNRKLTGQLQEVSKAGWFFRWELIG
jgi:hypothetical protein